MTQAGKDPRDGWYEVSESSFGSTSQAGKVIMPALVETVYSDLLNTDNLAGFELAM